MKCSHVRVKTYSNTSKLDEVRDSSTFNLVLHWIYRNGISMRFSHVIGQNLLCDDSHIWHALVVSLSWKSTYCFLLLLFFSNFFISSTGLQIRVRIVKLFLIYHPKHMLWVLKRTVSMRRFFEHPKHSINWWVRKYLSFYANKISLSGSMILNMIFTLTMKE